MSEFLCRYYGKKVIILLDEYDTPLQEAWVYGYWQEMVGFIRGLFNSTFKTHPYLEWAVMTGITRVGRESIFSDLNHLTVVTSTSELYELALTNKEVQIMLRKMIKKWFSGSGTVYNGFIRALLQDDVKSMNAYMNRVALATFSYFDSGKKLSVETQPERIWKV